MCIGTCTHFSNILPSLSHIFSKTHNLSAKGFSSSSINIRLRTTKFCMYFLYHSVSRIWFVVEWRTLRHALCLAFTFQFHQKSTCNLMYKCNLSQKQIKPGLTAKRILHVISIVSSVLIQEILIGYEPICLLLLLRDLCVFCFIFLLRDHLRCFAAQTSST